MIKCKKTSRIQSFDKLTSKVLKTETVSCNRNNIGLIQKLLLQRKETSSKVAKHVYYLYSKQCLGGIESNILFKGELPIEIEVQVLPVYLGFKNRSIDS